MQIIIDDREALDQPKTVEFLKENGKNEIIIKRLEVGDYFCYPVLVEAKNTLYDYHDSVNSSRIFQQAQDMLYNRQQNFDLKLYIMIAADIADFSKLTRPETSNGKTTMIPIKANPEGLIAAWSSLNRQGVNTSFVGNQWFFRQGLLDLFKKYNDGKIRTYNPIRVPITVEDQILTNYMSIADVGEKTAKELKKRFPYPKSLYTATYDELTSVDGIGDTTAIKLLKFFNGEK